ncbi:hypothetical protein X975_15682, partial [Stegodyphus mimosarum]
MKLPKIVLRKFDGELLNYLPFWAQFKEIHENEDLNDCEKFHYLSQSMLPGSRAKEFIDSYPITSENYEKAISALRKRFGNVELLTEVYVRELLKLVIQNVGNQKEKLPLSKLVDKLEAHLRALETMGVNPDNNAQWLFPLIESCLSEDLLKAWHRSSSRSEDLGVETSDEAFHASSQTMRLAQLMKFLHKEVENDERVLLARKSFRSLNSADSARDKIKKNEKRVPTTAGFFVGKEVKCVFCDKIHESKDCLKVRSLPLKEKIAIVKEKRCCLKCLRPGHIAKFCNSKICCHVCSKDHLVMLCPQLAHHKDREKGSEKTGDSPEVLQSTITNECSPDIALMTLEVNIIGDETKRVRVLLDTGSQKSYILSSTAKELNLKPVSTESLAHTLFGGAYIEAKPHQKFHIRLCSPNSKEILELEFLDQEIICGNVPRVPKNLLLTELKQNKIWLSDLGAGPTKIELLIGSDVYGRLLTGRIKQLQGGLTAVETKLGWTVCGPVENSAQTTLPVYTQTFKSNLVIGEMKVQELWKLETIGIMDPVKTLSKKKEEELAYENFLEEVKQNVDGCYRVFSEWLEEGVIEEVPRERTDIKGHFLPHHPVIKVNSLTTKIIPVFDASCKIGRNPYLNDCLLKGPNLIEQIPAILLRFREKVIGVVSDIKRAFLQIEVKPEDRDYLRFLWWRNENHIEEFQHNRVVFGATCSPFLLGARLSIMILEALALSDIPVYYWTDSTTALAWIRRNDEWGTFVGNRVREICKLTDPHQWHYIPGELNAADLPSRGCSPRQLLESRWWEGPEWLHKEEVYWPALTGQTDEEAVREERKKCVSLTSLIVTSETNNWYYVKPLIWKFIPPAAAWWGGWWERLIRSVKSLLLRVLGNSSVKYEELSTILCDVEAQINSRPLTYISDSSCDLVPLTPSMFLQDISDIGIPDLDTIDREKLQLRFKHCQKLRDELRTRFRKEYLGQLVQRAGEKSRSLKIGDVVLVGQDNVKRQHWPLARVEKIFPSRDGCPRVAQVKTKIGILVRPIRKLYPLEISEEDPIVQAIPERLSRFGRRIKTVQRLNLSKD